MKRKTVKLFKNIGLGTLIGAVNGCFGAGGGMVAVPLLKKSGLDQKSAHANAIAIILPITVLSAFMYLNGGYVKISDSLSYIPTGLLGSLLGTVFIRKISPLWLKRIFGAFMIYAGVRLLLR